MPTLVALVLGGCVPPPNTLMPTPTIFGGGVVDPFAGGAANGEIVTREVVVVTDREPSGTSKPATFYSNDRSRELRAAITSVRIGEGLSGAAVRQASLRHERVEEPRVKLLSLRQLGELASADRDATNAFVGEVNARLRRASRKEIDIFVHGYNTRFDRNVELAAELRHYMGGDAVTVSYAWPSQDSWFAYTVDKANAWYSVRFFRVLLELLAERTDADRINVLAHSAGAPIVVGAVRELRLMNRSLPRDEMLGRYRIGQIVLAAPDMDLLHFENALLDGFDQVPERVTLYISTADKALNFSAWVFGFARLGAPDGMEERDLEQFHESRTIQVIDVSSAEQAHRTWLGHSYFHEDEWVSSDLLMLFQHKANPRERGLIRPIGDPFWRFPPDYPLRAVPAARNLYRD